MQNNCYICRQRSGIHQSPDRSSVFYCDLYYRDSQDRVNAGSSSGMIARNSPTTTDPFPVPSAAAPAAAANLGGSLQGDPDPSAEQFYSQTHRQCYGELVSPPFLWQ